MKKLTINPPGKKQSASIMDRVKTFEDACQVLGIDQSELTVSGVLEEDFESISAYAKLIIINKALNEGWKPNWADDNEYKYYPWFDMSSGSGLRFHDFVYLYSYSDVGSRLCFKSSELAEFEGKQFLDIYTDFFIIK